MNRSFAAFGNPQRAASRPTASFARVSRPKVGLRVRVPGPAARLSPRPRVREDGGGGAGAQGPARTQKARHARAAPRARRRSARARPENAIGGTRPDEERAEKKVSTRANAGVARRSTSEKSAMERCRYGGRGVPAALSMVRAHAPCACGSDALFFSVNARFSSGGGGLANVTNLRFVTFEGDFGTLSSDTSLTRAASRSSKRVRARVYIPTDMLETHYVVAVNGHE